MTSHRQHILEIASSYIITRSIISGSVLRVLAGWIHYISQQTWRRSGKARITGRLRISYSYVYFNLWGSSVPFVSQIWRKSIRGAENAGVEKAVPSSRGVNEKWRHAERQTHQGVHDKIWQRGMQSYSVPDGRETPNGCSHWSIVSRSG